MSKTRFWRFQETLFSYLTLDWLLNYSRCEPNNRFLNRGLLLLLAQSNKLNKIMLLSALTIFAGNCLINLRVYPKQESNLHLHNANQILSLMRLPIPPFGLECLSFQAVTNSSMVEVNIIIRRIYFLVTLLMLLLKSLWLTYTPRGLAIY